MKHNIVIKICKYCGKEFITRVDNRPNRGLYCSNKCAGFAKGLKRLKNPKKPKLIKKVQCKACGNIFEQKNSRLYCGDECRKKYEAKYQKKRAQREKSIKTKPRKCKWCGSLFIPEYGNKKRVFCSTGCAKKADNALKAVASRIRSKKTKKRINNIHIDLINRTKIFERDNWRCQLCGKKINPKLKFPHPMSATIDHIIPLCDGGEHTERNLQAAHFICNSRRQDKGIVQLRLM